jgi:hypothetical protein
MTLPRPLAAAVGSLTANEIAEAVDEARDFLRGGVVAAPDARDFALALVQLSTACVVGLPCERHAGAVHGQEAEELRAGVEQILRNTAGVRDGEASFVLPELRKALIFLLDHVDARDSLAFLEATDGADAEHEADPALTEDRSP